MLAPEQAAATEGVVDEPTAALNRRVLEELIYERVKLTVDFMELLQFEKDLRVSLMRALDDCPDSATQRDALVFDYLHRAWERVTDHVLGRLWDDDLPPIRR
jgi:hypothetical protein